MKKTTQLKNMLGSLDLEFLMEAHIGLYISKHARVFRQV